MKPHIAFDIDGTICHTRPGTNHDDPADLLRNCVPFQDATSKIRNLILQGRHEVSFHTARPFATQEVTLQQLRDWIHPSIQWLQISSRQRFQFNWENYVPDKAFSLRNRRANHYIGDLEQDQEAAQQAGATFQWAIDFRRTGIKSLLKEPGDATPAFVAPARTVGNLDGDAK